MIFCSKWSVRPWFLQCGEQKTFQIAWKHTGVTGCQRTHVHIHMQVHRLTEKMHVHTDARAHTVTNKHRSMQKPKCLLHFSSAQQFSYLFLSVYILYIYFFPHSQFWHLLKTATGKNGHWSHESDLANGGALQHSMDQSSPAVGSGLFLDCVGLFEFKAWLRSHFDTFWHKDTHTLHSISTPSYLMRSKQNKRSNSLTLFFLFVTISPTAPQK